MAKFSYDGGEYLLEQLKRLGNVDEIATKMLKAAEPALTKSMKSEVASHKNTGSMAASIRPKAPTKTKNGYSLTVRPTGKDAKGVRNMEKLVYLEYGTSKQRATPVMKRIVSNAENEATRKMQEVFDQEAGN